MELAYGRRFRDPVHGYIYVPRELVALVASPFLGRLRRVSQNAGAQASYPALNGSRFEHALGTMHLAMSAWRHAWANAGGASAPEQRLRAQNQLATEVLRFVGSAQENCPPDPFLDRLVATQRTSGQDWLREFPELMEVCMGAVGLLHDVGHSPFSHTLESVFSGFRGLFFSAETVGDLERYMEKPGNDELQFHELCGWVITDSILRCAKVSSLFSTRLVWTIYTASPPDVSGTPAWALALREIISGQVDVDRLDYVMRDSGRAGTEFGSVDAERLLRSVELHYKPDDPLPWNIGFSVKGVSAIESLLENRERSYRWVYFHPASLASDTALKRSFRSLAAASVAPASSLDYVGSWADDGTYSGSFHADDTAALAYIRADAPAVLQSDERWRALMRIADGFDQDYVVTWRNYEEYCAALADMPGEWRLSLLNQASDGQGKDELPARSYAAGEDAVAAALNAVVRLKADQARSTGDGDELLDAWELLELNFEDSLNATQSSVCGVPGTWMVALRVSFDSGKAARIQLWKKDERVRFGRVSPGAAGLVEADKRRVQAWGFFVPFDHTKCDAANLAVLGVAARRVFLSVLVEEIQTRKES